MRLPHEIYGAEWGEPEASSPTMLHQGVLTMKIAGIARDRRHRRNLALPITAISRDDGDSADSTGEFLETAW